MLDAAEDALGELSVLTVAGELVPVATARARPWDVAAANWVATALAVADAHRRRAADRRRQHDHRRHPDRRRARRRDRPQRPRAAAGGRARLHRRAAHQPGGDRAARAGPRRLVPGRRRSSSRSAPTSTSCSAIWRRRPTTARRPTAARPRSRSRASGSPGWSARTSSSSTQARSTRSRRSSTTSSCARSRTRRAGCCRRGAGRRGRLRRLPRPRGRGAPGTSGGRLPHLGPGGGAGRAAGETPVLTVVKVGGGVGADALRALCTTLGELGRAPSAARRARRRRVRRRRP